MKDVLIACKMMEMETRAALEQTGAAPEVIWMDKGLHNRPEDLREALQEALKTAEAEFHRGMTRPRERMLPGAKRSYPVVSPYQP